MIFQEMQHSLICCKLINSCNMNMYAISYVSTNGTIVLNYLVEASSPFNAIQEVKDETTLVLSVVRVRLG